MGSSEPFPVGADVFYPDDETPAELVARVTAGDDPSIRPGSGRISPVVAWDDHRALLAPDDPEIESGDVLAAIAVLLESIDARTARLEEIAGEIAGVVRPLIEQVGPALTDARDLFAVLRTMRPFRGRT